MTSAQVLPFDAVRLLTTIGDSSVLSWRRWKLSFVRHPKKAFAKLPSARSIGPKRVPCSASTKSFAACSSSSSSTSALRRWSHIWSLFDVCSTSMRAFVSVKSFLMVTGCGSGTASPATFHIAEIFVTNMS